LSRHHAWKYQPHLLAKASAAPFEAGGVTLAFGRGEGAGWQRNVTLADGITYDRVLATYPPPVPAATIRAAFLVTVPAQGARLTGRVGLPEASRSGSAVRLELLRQTGSGNEGKPLAEPVTLLPGRAPRILEANLTALADRTGFVVARLTIVRRADRAWPTWCALRLVEP
jgi:hypothetical protein